MARFDGFRRVLGQLKPAQNQQTTRFNCFHSAVRMLLTTTDSMRTLWAGWGLMTSPRRGSCTLAWICSDALVTLLWTRNSTPVCFSVDPSWRSNHANMVSLYGLGCLHSTTFATRFSGHVLWKGMVSLLPCCPIRASCCERTMMRIHVWLGRKYTVPLWLVG